MLISTLINNTYNLMHFTFADNNITSFVRVKPQLGSSWKQAGLFVYWLKASGHLFIVQLGNYGLKCGKCVREIERVGVREQPQHRFSYAAEHFPPKFNCYCCAFLGSTFWCVFKWGCVCVCVLCALCVRSCHEIVLPVGRMHFAALTNILALSQLILLSIIKVQRMLNSACNNCVAHTPTHRQQ